jgi:hypothetical protein
MSRSDALLTSLRVFFADPTHSSVLLDILDHKCGVSLRTLESFVTRKENVTYTTKTGKTFVVHVAYKSSLVGYSKKLFDPFCRTERIEFDVGPEPRKIITTVAQLNFIKWCIVNDVIDYLKQSEACNIHRKISV